MRLDPGYGIINVVFDANYGTYGVYGACITDASVLVPGGFGSWSLAQDNSIVPSMPFAAYGGMKVGF